MVVKASPIRVGSHAPRLHHLTVASVFLSMTQLDLSRNRFGPDGCKHLADALRASTSLTEVTPAALCAVNRVSLLTPLVLHPSLLCS